MKIGAGGDRGRILKVLRESLVADEWPPNLDVKVLKDAEPWQRLRVGDWRILFRVATDKELMRLKRLKRLDVASVIFVARIVNRRDLEKAVSTLA